MGAGVMSNDFKDLLAYKKAFQLAMDIFNITKGFPVDEKYGLIYQIRRSSRSVCSNLAEGYRKRQYQKHFLSKVSDADMETVKHRYGLISRLPVNTLIEKHMKII